MPCHAILPNSPIPPAQTWKRKKRRQEATGFCVLSTGAGSGEREPILMQTTQRSLSTHTWNPNKPSRMTCGGCGAGRPGVNQSCIMWEKGKEVQSEEKRCPSQLLASPAPFSGHRRAPQRLRPDVGWGAAPSSVSHTHFALPDPRFPELGAWADLAPAPAKMSGSWFARYVSGAGNPRRQNNTGA